jgi:hypothetical protein
MSGHVRWCAAVLWLVGPAGAVAQEGREPVEWSTPSSTDEPSGPAHWELAGEGAFEADAMRPLDLLPASMARVETLFFTGRSGGLRQTVVAPRVTVRVSPWKHVVLALDTGTAFGVTNMALGPDEAETQRVGSRALGNTAVGAFYRDRIDDVTVEIGARVTLPTYVHGSNEPGQGTQAPILAAAADGFWDYGNWLHNTVSFSPAVRMEMDALPQVVLAVETALSFIVGYGHARARGVEQEMLVQAALEGAYRFNAVSVVGLRMQAVWLTAGHASQNVQMAMGPFTRIGFGRPDRGGFIHGQLLMALDQPLGPAFTDGGFWGLTLGGGLTY